RTLNNFQRMRLPDRSGDAATTYVRSFREMNLRELVEQSRVASTAMARTRQRAAPDLRENYALAHVEIHKKFAIPFACVVFGVLGLPLGITNRGGGESSGFSMSVVIVRANHISFHTLFAYYRFMLFQIMNWTLPISVLVATLITFSLFSKNNEVTAFKSGGISLYRVAMPIVAIAVMMSALSYLMLDYVLPYSNQRVDQLKKKIRGQRTVAAQNQQKLWFLGKGNYIINFLSYDKTAKQLSQVQVFEYRPADFRITRRVYADSAKWDGSGWVFEHGRM